MRIVSVNLTNGSEVSAAIHSGAKSLTRVDDRKLKELSPLNESEIKSINVIVDGKVDEIPLEKFWNYDAMVNILGDDE